MQQCELVTESHHNAKFNKRHNRSSIFWYSIKREQKNKAVQNLIIIATYSLEIIKKRCINLNYQILSIKI